MVGASEQNRVALRQLKPELPAWYICATQAQKDTLNKGNALEDLLKAQEAWAADGRLSGTEKAALRKTFDIAGRRLGKPTQDIRPGQVMTDEQYTADYSTLAEETQNIRRRPCDKTMGRKSAETKS
ncbi:hypothetical protein CI807_09600 [Pseudomonas sp. NS1(2017)]|nr:hypothetical protein CI807_09600 [Pseudomonas sp. NS1(2017)]